MRPKPIQLNVAEAKRELSSLLARVAFGGESITITRRGRPMACLVPVGGDSKGLADTKGWLDDDDPFFAAVDARVATRGSRPARALAAARRKKR